jgi:Predicted secreted (periplasmic) protein
MSWSERLLRSGFLGFVLVAGGALSACTMAPVYSNPQAVAQRLAFTYAEPNSRLEQIVYQELRLRLGESHAPDARRARVALAVSGGRVGLSENINPQTMGQMTVTATLTLAPPAGGTAAPVTITRTATANYTTNSQAFSAREAVIEAQERAARAVAESLRLALLAGAAR